MAAYLLFMREGAVRDQHVFARYSELARQVPPTAGFDPLIVYGGIKSIEGDPADGIVLIKFDDEAAARAWYDSKEYQKAAPFRKECSDYRVMLVQGL